MDKLSYDGIMSHIADSKIVIDFHEEVTSTNDIAVERSKEPEGLVVVAGMQTAGRGRNNKSFYSPDNTGAYFSILLKPTISDPTLLTALAGVAVAEAIEDVAKSSPRIKWVNDVFIDGRKVCGILAQGAFNFDKHQPEYIIVGIGINIYSPNEGFPELVDNVAGSVFSERASGLMNKLTASVINKFFSHYDKLHESDFISRYKAYSMLIGHDVCIHIGTDKKQARVLDIDDSCRLVVRYADNTVEHLSTGEVSVRI